MMTDELDGIFRPKSIAVIGASSKKGTIGHSILQRRPRHRDRRLGPTVAQQLGRFGLVPERGRSTVGPLRGHQGQ